MLGLSSTSTTGTWLNLTSSAGGAQWNLISTGSTNSEGAGKLLVRDNNNGAVRATFDTNGRLGIGTSSPTATLHVAGSAAIDGSNALEFGTGVSGKEANAGKIGYQTFTPGALDIVGAGTTNANRKIKLFAEGGLDVNGGMTTTGNVGVNKSAPTSTLQSMPESGHWASYDGAKRRKGREVHVAVDTLGHLLAAVVTPANEQDQAQVSLLAQEVSGQSVTLAYADQGYTGEVPVKAAEQHGIDLQMVKLGHTKRGFVLLPRRWVVERSLSWSARYKRLARDYERLALSLQQLHYLAFVGLMLTKAATLNLLSGS